MFLKQQNFLNYKRYIDSGDDYLDKNHFKVVKVDNIAEEIVKIITKQAGNEFLKRGRVEVPKIAAGIAW